jgi:hypothetical protein
VVHELMFFFMGPVPFFPLRKDLDEISRNFPDDLRGEKILSLV